jgi:hypothetical protein
MAEEVREYVKLGADLTKALAWPVVTVWLVTRFRDTIHSLAQRSKKVVLKVAGSEIQIDADTANAIISQLIEDVDTIFNGLTPQQKAYLYEIASSSSGGQMYQLPATFIRESEEHQILRALRTSLLIRTITGPRFEAGKKVEVTRFGRLILDLKREQLLESAGKLNRLKDST